MNVSRPNQDRTEFESLLNHAVAIDPAADKSNQLTTIVTQRRAKALLDHVNTLFVQ